MFLITFPVAIAIPLFLKFSNSPVCKWQQSVVFPHDSSSKCTCKATQKALFCGFCRKKNDEKNHEGLRLSRCYHSGGEFKSKDFLTKSLNGKNHKKLFFISHYRNNCHLFFSRALMNSIILKKILKYI